MRLPMPALISPLRVHLPYMVGAALLAFAIIVGLYLAYATRFTAVAQVAVETGGRTVSADRLEAYLEDPARIGRTVDRLALVAPRAVDRLAPESMQTVARDRAIARLIGGLSVEQSDLTNVFTLRYSGNARRMAAPIVNDIADGFVRDSAALSGVRARIVNRAIDPVAPDGSLLLPAGFALLGMGLAAAGTFLIREMRQKGPLSAGSAERVLGLPVVAMIPTVPGMPQGQRAALAEMPVSSQQSEYARAFRRMLASGQPTGRIVAVCSALAGEGKSTFAISLARSAAIAGRRVALVDCDGRIRAASIALDVVGRPGLIQVIDGETPLDEALVPDTRSSLSILPHSRDAEIRSLWSKTGAAGLREIAGELARSFDLVVIDTPPLLALVEAREIAGVADEALVVARWRATPLPALRLAIRQLVERQVHAALVLSFVRFAEPDRGPIVPAQRHRRPGHALVMS